MKNYREGLNEVNRIFRTFIDNRNTVQAEYYHFRERALKNIVAAMSHSKNNYDFVLIEGLLTEYYEEQGRLI
jgi:hypothetical protein